MGCTYTFKADPNNKKHSYLDLIEEYRKKRNAKTANDLVLSRDAALITQEDIVSKLVELRKEGFSKSNTSFFDGEPIISDNDSISGQEFIDSNQFTLNGKPLIYKLHDSDYISETATALVSEGLSEEEAKEIAQKEVDKWQIIADDGTDLHILLSKMSSKDYDRQDFESDAKGTKFEAVAGELWDSYITFKEKTLGGILRKNGGQHSRIIYNLNIKNKIENIDKDLFGHIDMVVVDASGDVHLFNFKTTTSTIQPQSVKLEKYKYQMALLKQMLASQGISVRHATLNIVPVKIKYNEDLSVIKSAIMRDTPIELTVFNGKYVFGKYDKVARNFIKSSVVLDSINDEDVDIVNEQLKLIFPARDIQADGVRLTALEWVKKNKSHILDSNNPEYAYQLELGQDKIIPIKSNAKPEKNTEILEHVIRNGKELFDTNNDVVLHRLLKDIKAGINTGITSFLTDSAYATNGAYLHKILSKYFVQKSKEEGSEWELLENDTLNSAGIILIKNKITHQLDVITLSTFNLGTEINIGKRGNTVLGYYLPDNKSGSLFNYRANYGNIEAVRTMVLLNQVLPKIKGDLILGKLQVLSLRNGGQGIPFSIETLSKECFTPIIQYVNTKLPNTTIKNNFGQYYYISRFQTLLQEYESIIQDNKASESEKQQLIETGFGALASAETVEAKITALREVEKALKDGFPQLDTTDFQVLLKDPSFKKIALLYQQVVNAITYYTVGEISPTEKVLSGMDRYGFVSGSVPNRNFRIIVDLYTKTINSIAEQAENKWVPIRKLLYKYYDDIGYTKLQNATIGNQASQFEDLYRKDNQGHNLLRLLNPYDVNDMAQITSHKSVKQEFLKRILFEFAKVRYPMMGISFNFTSVEDPNLQAFIKNHSDTYFNIPLERASKSTRLQKYSIKEKLSYAKNLAMELLKNPKKGVEEYINDIDNKEEQELRDVSIKAMKLQNKFLIGERVKRNNYMEGLTREGYISEYGEGYFETNLESLLADFIERDIETRELNKALIVIKGVLFQLDILGENPNMEKVVKQTISMIDDFVKVNVFRTSIMDEASQRIVGLTTPLRRLVSNTLIAGNIKGAVRDTFEGAWQNTMRSLNHYQTNISPKSLTKAYGTVIKNSFSDSRSINIVNQLCQIYRLSNMDISRISEGLKSERGITNYQNWMYSTLRAPDFLNRMTLFVAKCYEDGVYDAFDIKDGKLVYDWKKDERFKIFASGNKSNPKYYEQMGAYFNAIRAYNQDHPEQALQMSDDLPMPYNFQEVNVIRHAADTIYGSYDKSTRAAYEHMALGTFFGMFSTWMNGIYANYMLKPGQYSNTEFKLEQDLDDSGRPLFFDNSGRLIYAVQDNGSTKYYYDGTEIEATENITHIQPVLKKVPTIVQGIMYTLYDVFKAVPQGTFKEDIWLDPMQRKNLMKLLTDGLAWLFFGTLYSQVLNPAYSNFKKEQMPKNNALVNAAVEILYGGSSRSYDGFRGIYNVFEYLGENTNPPIYSQNIKLMTDLLKVSLGEKAATDMAVQNIAVLKSFQDTYKAEKKK